MQKKHLRHFEMVWIGECTRTLVMSDYSRLEDAKGERRVNWEAVDVRACRVQYSWGSIAGLPAIGQHCRWLSASMWGRCRPCCRWLHALIIACVWYKTIKNVKCSRSECTLSCSCAPGAESKHVFSHSSKSAGSGCTSVHFKNFLLRSQLESVVLCREGA